MSSNIVFFGHGEFSGTEVPMKTVVPEACKLFLFARHREMIAPARMWDIITALIHHKGNQEGFTKDVKEDTYSLRRIKFPGEDVHNYRLYPVDDRLYDIGAKTNKPESTSWFTIVTTEKKEGETLQSLMQHHKGKGVNFYWLPCRSIPDKSKCYVDLFGKPTEQTAEGAQIILSRPSNYFKAHPKH